MEKEFNKEKIEQMNIAGASYSIACGERNTALGDHSILIGKDLKTDENFKLIVKVKSPFISYPSSDIDIEETISKREHYLIYSAVCGAMYLDAEENKEFTRQQVKDFVTDMLTKMMPKYKELEDFKGKDIVDAIEFGENKSDNLERLVYLRAISELDERLNEFFKK